jgi:hypothetical protein
MCRSQRFESLVIVIIIIVIDMVVDVVVAPF